MQKKNLFLLALLVFAFSFVGLSAFAQTAGVSHNPLEITCTNQLCIKSNGVGIGTTSPSYRLHVAGDIYSNWLRTWGDTGWYSENHGGGWNMSDNDWIRAVNSKPVYSDSEIRSGTTLRAQNFIDLNDGSYYLDPNGTSRLAGILMHNGGTLDSEGRLHIASNETIYLLSRSGNVNVSGAWGGGGNLNVDGRLEADHFWNRSGYIYVPNQNLYVRNGQTGEAGEHVALHSKIVYTWFIQNDHYDGNINIVPMSGNLIVRSWSGDNANIQVHYVYAGGSSGLAYSVGDDAWIADCNWADHMCVVGKQSGWARGRIAMEDWDQWSSAKYKTGISPLGIGDYSKMLNTIKKTDVYSFYRKGNQRSQKEIGLIAEKAPKEIVSGNGKTIAMSQYMNYLFGGFKGLVLENENQQKEIDQLKRELEYLKRK